MQSVKECHNKMAYKSAVTAGGNLLNVNIPNLSFEAVDSEFVYKVGQKIGIAVYRNYKLDFTNDDTHTNNRWKKEDFPQNAIMRIFGEDNAVNIYTGEITAVTPDKEVFRHSINAFRGCAGRDRADGIGSDGAFRSRALGRSGYSRQWDCTASRHGRCL